MEAFECEIELDTALLKKEAFGFLERHFESAMANLRENQRPSIHMRHPKIS